MRRAIGRATEGNATPISNTVIVLALIGALTALVWIGKVNGDAFISVASVIVGAVLVRQGVSAGAKASTDATTPPPGD